MYLVINKPRHRPRSTIRHPKLRLHNQQTFSSKPDQNTNMTDHQNQVPGVARQGAPTSLSCFGNLSTEIRLKIWHHAIASCPQCTIPSSFIQPISVQYPHPRLPPKTPSLLHVNRKSRELAIEEYVRCDYPIKGRYRGIFIHLTYDTINFVNIDDLNDLIGKLMMDSYLQPPGTLNGPAGGLAISIIPRRLSLPCFLWEVRKIAIGSCSNLNYGEDIVERHDSFTGGSLLSPDIVHATLEGSRT